MESYQSYSYLERAGFDEYLAELDHAFGARLIALGATRADIGQGEPSWEVLADPEGNEFCVLGPRAPQS